MLKRKQGVLPCFLIREKLDDIGIGMSHSISLDNSIHIWYNKSKYIYTGMLLTMEPSKMKSFEDYYKLYYEQVKKFILKRVGDEQVAEDLTSDVFTSCLDSFDRFDPEKASFRTWLFVITKNRLKNYFRDRKIFDELSDECAVYERFEDEIVQAQYLSMLRDDIATALLTLPLVQKEIVKRRYFMNQNSFEIAEILGISPVNVRVQLSRALVKLREYLEESGVDPRDL